MTVLIKVKTVLMTRRQDCRAQLSILADFCSMHLPICRVNSRTIMLSSFRLLVGNEEAKSVEDVAVSVAQNADICMISLPIGVLSPAEVFMGSTVHPFHSAGYDMFSLSCSDLSIPDSRR